MPSPVAQGGPAVNLNASVSPSVERFRLVAPDRTRDRVLGQSWCAAPRADGRYRRLTGGLYRQAKTAGYLYQAELRGRLTEALGVAWRAVEKGRSRD